MMRKERPARLASVLGANENRKRDVQDGTFSANRSLQRRNEARSRSGTASFAGRQVSTVRRPFAAFDIDGTLIRWQLYHAIADALAKRNYINPAQFESIREARMSWKNRTHSEAFKSYEGELVKLYDRALTSLKVTHFNEAAEAVFDEYKDQVYTYTRDLISELKKRGYLFFAISGSQTEIVEKIAQYYGFDDYSGTTYLQKDGKFSGQVIYAAASKDVVLNQLIRKHEVSLEGSLALGDSAGDIKMLDLVEEPIAFNPEAKLFKVAKEKSWKVVIERKNMVYELESKNGKYRLVKTNT